MQTPIPPPKKRKKWWRGWSCIMPFPCQPLVVTISPGKLGCCLSGEFWALEVRGRGRQGYNYLFEQMGWFNCGVLAFHRILEFITCILEHLNFLRVTVKPLIGKDWLGLSYLLTCHILYLHSIKEKSSWYWEQGLGFLWKAAVGPDCMSRWSNKLASWCE